MVRPIAVLLSQFLSSPFLPSLSPPFFQMFHFPFPSSTIEVFASWGDNQDSRYHWSPILFPLYDAPSFHFCLLFLSLHCLSPAQDRQLDVRLLTSTPALTDYFCFFQSLFFYCFFYGKGKKNKCSQHTETTITVLLVSQHCKTFSLCKTVSASNVQLSLGFLFLWFLFP